MEIESTIGLATVAMLGLALSWVGWLGRTRRIDFAMGGWTPANTTETSWDRANRKMGNAILAYGIACLVGASGGFLLGDDRALAAVFVGVTLGAISMLLAVVLAIRTIEPTGPKQALYDAVSDRRG